MSLTQQLLHAQLNAYSDAWKQRHHEAMEVWDLEAVLRSGLGIFDSIEALVRHRNQEIDHGRQSFDIAEMEALQKLYAAWLVPSRELLADVLRCENNGFVVETAAAFRKACREASETADRNFAEELASIRELEAGGGMSLQEVRDELRRQHLGQCP